MVKSWLVQLQKKRREIKKNMATVNVCSHLSCDTFGDVKNLICSGVLKTSDIVFVKESNKECNCRN